MRAALAWILMLAFAPLELFAQNAPASAPLIVENIECRGNVITPCDLIRDRLYLKSGERINEEEIGNAKLRLSSLPNFTSVDIHLEKGSERGRAVVVIEVIEADPWTKESVFATAARVSTAYERVAGRISNENLFGTGKILSLEGGVTIPISGFSGSIYYSRLQYVDPRLFNSSKYFLIGGAFYERVSETFASGNSFEHKLWGMDLTVGRRIFDFSYVSLGYRQLPTASFSNRVGLVDGTFDAVTGAYDSNLLIVSYGWNTEDDPFFPTRGSRFQISDAMSLDRHFHSFTGGYRHSFKFDNSIWTIKWLNAPGIIYRGSLDRSPDVAVTFSRPLAAGGEGELRRGRWYIEPGGQSITGHIWEMGIRAGVRLDTRTFGHVDLYIFGSDAWDSGGGQ